MKFSLDELSAPMTIEKIKILGAVLELSAKQPCQANPFASFFTVAALPLIRTKIICIQKTLEVADFIIRSIITSFIASFKSFLKVGKYACLFH